MKSSATDTLEFASMSMKDKVRPGDGARGEGRRTTTTGEAVPPLQGALLASRPGRCLPLENAGPDCPEVGDARVVRVRHAGGVTTLPPGAALRLPAVVVDVCVAVGGIHPAPGRVSSRACPRA